MQGISGKLGGCVFRLGKAGGSIAMHTMPGKFTGENYSTRFNQYGKIAKAWRALTDNERTAWRRIAESHPWPDRFGTPRQLTGWQWFQKYNLLWSGPNYGTPLAPTVTTEIATTPPFRNTVEILTYSCIAQVLDPTYGLLTFYGTFSEPMDFSARTFLKLQRGARPGSTHPRSLHLVTKGKRSASPSVTSLTIYYFCGDFPGNWALPGTPPLRVGETIHYEAFILGQDCFPGSPVRGTVLADTP